VAAAAGRDTVVVAGGLGLAPLRIAIDQLVAALSAGGAGSPSRLTVVIGARDPSQLTFLADIERWQSSGAHVHTTVDHPDDTWTGSVGNTTVVLEQMGEARGLALVCGPEPMMTSAAHTLVRLGTPPDTVHLSLERNMHCGIAHCGRCQLGPLLLCRDGAVVGWNQVAHLLEVHGR
jgi:NAD(P)H-flavin reductase